MESISNQESSVLLSLDNLEFFFWFLSLSLGEVKKNLPCGLEGAFLIFCDLSEVGIYKWRTKYHYNTSIYSIISDIDKKSACRGMQYDIS